MAIKRGLQPLWHGIECELSGCRRMRIVLLFPHQTSAHRIHSNVFAMPHKILIVPNSMIRKPRLPDRQTRLQSKRESSLDELDRPLQRYLGRRRDQRMEVVGHDHKLMNQIFALVAVAEKDIDEQVGGGGALE